MRPFTSLKHVTPENERHTCLTHLIFVVRSDFAFEEIHYGKNLGNSVGLNDTFSG